MSTRNPYQAPLADKAPKQRPTGRTVRWTSTILCILLGLHLVVRVLAIGVDVSMDLIVLSLEGNFDLEEARRDAEILLWRLGSSERLER